MKGVSKETGRSVRFKDRTGARNGRLLFIELAGFTVHKHSLWRAICDCGNETFTATPTKTQSCGCLHSEIVSKNAKKRAVSDAQRKENAKKNAQKQNARRAKIPVFAMQKRLSRLHRHALSQVNAIKTSPTFEQLGYTADEFVKHIERQFVKGMGWHNMSDWQIDHIIPISTAKTVEDVIALNQLSNLRPLWAKENNRKKDKCLSLL